MRAHLLPKLRCHFAEFLNQSSLKRLGMLSLPTCVGLRYGLSLNSTRGFSRKYGINQLRRIRRIVASLPSGLCLPLLSKEAPYSREPRVRRPLATMWLTYPSPSPLASTLSKRCRNINLHSITYAFRPRLRDRLTLGGLSCPRKPWAFGETVSHRLYRYSCRHSHLEGLQHPLRYAFTDNSSAPLPLHIPAGIRNPQLRYLT